MIPELIPAAGLFYLQLMKTIHFFFALIKKHDIFISVFFVKLIRRHQHAPCTNKQIGVCCNLNQAVNLQ